VSGETDGPTPGGIEVTHDPEIPVRLVQLRLCDPCLDGVGGECHTPGCSLWINRAPDLPIRNGVSVRIIVEPEIMDGPTLGQVAFAEYYGRQAGAALVMPDSWARWSDAGRADWEAAGAAVAATAIARLNQTGELAGAMTENVRLRKDLADAEAEIGRWPRCPAGCPCRVGTDDADALECGCDGPCTTGWDAPRAAPEPAEPVTVAGVLCRDYPSVVAAMQAEVDRERTMRLHLAGERDVARTAVRQILDYAWTLSDKLGHREQLSRIANRAIPAADAYAKAAPAPTAAMPRVDWARVSEAVADRERERDRLRELLDEIGVMAANAPEEGDSFGLLEEIAMRIAAVDVPDSTPIDEWPDPENPITGRTPGGAADMSVTVNGEPVPRTSGNALAVSPELGAAKAEATELRAVIDMIWRMCQQPGERLEARIAGLIKNSGMEPF
jgi:hypothetical protein